MKKFLLNFVFFATVSSLLGCSLGMMPAVAPTAPPQVLKSKNAFNHLAMVGTYKSQSLPQMFLWPTDKVVESGELVPLSFNEKAKSRQKITSIVDVITEYATKKNAALKKIETQFSTINLLEKLFTEQACYKYCDENDFFSCNPSNECALFNETWKTPEGPEEEAVIFECHSNQEKRVDLQTKKDKLVAAEVLPLEKQESAATYEFLGVIARGHFQDLQQLKLDYNPERALDSELKLSIKYGSITYRTHAEQGVEGSFAIRDVVFDKIDGYLSFVIDAIDLENPSLQAYGEIRFDLELTVVGSFLKVDGNIELVNKDPQVELKLGRFSDAGAILPFDYVAPKCK